MLLKCLRKRFLSTLSLRRATTNSTASCAAAKISIHALLAESDCPGTAGQITSYGFLSTLSLRRATAHGVQGTLCTLISIHALLAESDAEQREVRVPIAGFLSTLSLRRATAAIDRHARRVGISIHALLAESDFSKHPGIAARAVFLSTLSLRRATSIAIINLKGGVDFYPRSPCGERQVLLHLISHIPVISIHALLAESDVHHKQHITPHNVFLSTLSLRRATLWTPTPPLRQSISIHALLAESDNMTRNYIPRMP